MTLKRKCALIFSLALLLVAVVAGVIILCRLVKAGSDGAIVVEIADTTADGGKTSGAAAGDIEEVEPSVPDAEAPADGETAEVAEQNTAEEEREAEEEARVDSFDELTDTWMEPSTNGVSDAAVETFVSKFNEVPKDRREECLQRALNLVPDENIMLLMGILLDKRQDKDLLEMIFNDVLNRNDEVKLPILRHVYADKTHPCWKDAAWILDEDDGEKGGK